MRFEEVRAKAFGPFQDEILNFAPGMNVIYGPNESGKSTWHAAMYLGLCGLRRGSGRRKEDQPLHRYKPWSGGAWETITKIRLEDGRKIEIRNDLGGLIGCEAHDDLGRDLSAEIMYDGSPDGSRFLKLDRRSFLATACIRQGDVLEVARESDLLHEYIQRAAATAGTDATAAEALRVLESF